MMLLRARSLAMGRSGARPVLAETMLALLDAGLDAGGARARLARRQRRPRAARPLRAGPDRRGRGAGPAGDAPARGARRSPSAGIEPLVLSAKEGLALINGTDGILGMLVLALDDLGALLRVADVTAAMSHRGAARHRPRLRRRPGRAAPAARPGRQRREPARGCSPARRSSPATATATRGFRTPTRCAARPQVHGAARDTLAHAERVADAELAAAIDNPMVLPDGRVESCGNFHGAPLALACDFLAIAAAEVGAIAERRTDRLLDASRSHGLPPFLAADAGRRLGADDRPVHAGGDGRPRTAGWRPRPRSTRCRRPRCRRTTSRWAGARRASCAPSVANLRRILAVELTCAAAGSSCARRSSPAPAPAPRSPRCARGRRRPGPGPLARAGARRGRGAARRRRGCWTRSRPRSGSSG